MSHLLTRHPYYQETPRLVQETMDEVAAVTGRPYKLFDYHGHPEAESVCVIMGSGATTVREVVDHLNTNGEKIGLIKVRLFNPW